jgi:maltose alpha-D-glucosyltransferase / alpha-amylase
MARGSGGSLIQDDPLWYKDAIIYQLHVKAFFDSNGDGIGDFAGLTEKLDYLQDLGVTAIWILPFYPSPLKDDGYDIASYTGIHPSYGVMKDFRRFLSEAHKRGLRVITELVINHTSDQHPWFQRARRAKRGSAARDFYVWSDTPDLYREARIIFKDFETSNWSWDPVANAYYWHRFYSHQPDLNFENPAVRETIFEILDSWVSMGVDGLRLDAIPYLYERDGTSCENLPETHAYLKELRAHLEARHPHRMLLAEANQWPEDAREYFGEEGDECNVAFHFPLMPRLFMSIAMEDRFPIIDIMAQTPEIPESCQWAIFLRNHDELTLEMVTDEDRDYMYRTYAEDPRARINLGIRRRLAPLLGNQRKRIELMNALLFSFRGTPIIYYGDEIGMGDNIYLGDRHGVRTPMQWSPDRNAGFSRVNPQKLYLPVIIDPEYHYEAVNVEAQQNNTQSLLWWTKRLIALRKQYRAFGRGTLEFFHPENRKVLVFARCFEEETILVVANLSRFVQYVELDLGRFRGMTPVELFGHTRFPEIGTQPYFVTLGPHNFYWFALEKSRESVQLDASGAPQFALIPAESWSELLRPKTESKLRSAIADYVRNKRWFGAKARDIKGSKIVEVITLPDARAELTIVEIEFVEGVRETYLLPLAVASGEEALRIERDSPEAVVARLSREGDRLLYEPTIDRTFQKGLLKLVNTRRTLKGRAGELRPLRLPGSSELSRSPQETIEPSLSRAEQSNTSIFYGDRFFLKLFRRIEPGQNVDLEVTRHLMEKTRFRNIAPLLGAVEYVRKKGESSTLAMVQRFVPSGGDAWSYTLDEIGRFFDRVATRSSEEEFEFEVPADLIFTLSRNEIPTSVRETLGKYAADAELLGRRTAELHLAFAAPSEDPAFAPEPFTPFYQRSVYQQMRTQATVSLQLLRKGIRKLEGEESDHAQRILDSEQQILAIFRTMVGRKIGGLRTRLHGDYHLGQALYTGKDFIIIDFEGEPSRPIGERRIKRGPLRDVAGMLRSFHYAPHAILSGVAPGVNIRPEDAPLLTGSAAFWRKWVSALFLREYFAVAGEGNFLPDDVDERERLLEAYLLEKALYELGYELNNRPQWTRIPLLAILELLEGS